jgi:hypothetical protein
MVLLRRLGIAAATAALALGAACHGDPTEPEYGPDAEARAAADAFYQVADSLGRAGADVAVVSGYYGLARYVMGVGRVSPVTISIDGTAEEYLATVQELGLEPASCAVGTTCLTLPRIRGFVAWRRGDPRRVVQLTAAWADGPLPAPSPPVEGRLLGGPTITFFDGAGGFLAGSTGTSSIDLTSASDELCYRAPPGPGVVYDASSSTVDPYWNRCTKAEFNVAFSGTVQPPAVGGPRGNLATGSHTLAMLARPVHGGRTSVPRWSCFACALVGYPDFILPPLNVQPRAFLSSTLTAVVADVVTLTFTVKNTGTAPATMQFTTEKRYDFVITDPQGTQILWRWSADKAFPQALGSRTLAPGEQVVFTAQWTPTAKGQLLAQATLASSSHTAYTGRFFLVP